MAPIFPQPMTPRVFPVISTPINFDFSQRLFFVDVSACGICLASDIIKVIACSAVVTELPNGVFITITPFVVAVSISTLSTPIPALPITFRFFALLRILSVTFVADLIAKPS